MFKKDQIVIENNKESIDIRYLSKVQAKYFRTNTRKQDRELYILETNI